jgi:ABC-type transport system involved in cytochrome c biogenesis permease subunit
MNAIWLFQTAFALQLLAVAFFAGYAVSPNRSFSVMATLTLGFALGLQCLFTLFLAMHNGSLPLGNAFEALNFWALLFTGLTLGLERRYQMGLLGAFLVPFSALLMLMGIRFSHVAAGAELPVGGLFLLLHVGLPMAGYALFTASAGVAIAWLIEERQIKTLHLGPVYELPALEVLENLATRLASWGLLGLSIGLVAGFVAHRDEFVVRLGSDPKIAMSFLAWLFYAASLLLRRGGLRGRRFAYLLLLGFGALFFSYYLVNVFWGGHAFAAQGH